MALNKTVIQGNGIPLSYHRISNITNVINDSTYINIISYVDEEQRRKEQKIKEIDPEHRIRPDEIFIAFSSVKTSYNDTLTIEEAYEYLKTLEIFEGSEDI